MVFFENTGICNTSVPTEPPLDQLQVHPTDYPNDEEVLQLEEFNSDKCDFTFESVKGAIIKEVALLNEGVQGNFKPCLQFWQNTLQSPKFVRNVIQRGYVLPFKTIPPSAFLLNNRGRLYKTLNHVLITVL